MPSCESRSFPSPCGGGPDDDGAGAVAEAPTNAAKSIRDRLTAIVKTEEADRSQCDRKGSQYPLTCAGDNLLFYPDLIALDGPSLRLSQRESSFIWGD
jgi:hypothetical protein